ncbi:Protein of unknown function [Gryllus bimaculatus]|nr:Protein of unknown function [Gryllus bimaculatus]
MDEYERVIPRLVAETERADENEDYMDTALCKACVANQQRYEETQKELNSVKGADSKLTELRREHEEEMAKLTDSLQEAKTQFRNEFGPYNELKVEVATLKKKYDYFKGLLEARLRGHTPINP